MPERARQAADVTLAAACGALLTLNVLTDQQLRPKSWLLGFGLTLALPLAVRRRYPATVAIACSTAYALLDGFSDGRYPPDLAVVPLMIAIFSGATYTRGRTALLMAISTFIAVEVGWVIAPGGDIAQFFPWVLWGGPFGVGRLTRRRDVTVSELTLQALLLEAKRAAAEQEATRRERDRIARELHDVIAHAVSVMVVQAGAERLALNSNGADVVRTTTALARVEQAGREALAELRAMLGVLRAPADEQRDSPAHPQPRLEGIHEIVDRLCAEGVAVRLRIEGVPAPTHDAASQPAYRIVQEALTNAVKHGDGNGVEVVVRYDDDAIRLEVSNSARRSERSATEPGYGLVGARERAMSLGGEFRSERRGQRWVLTATLPCADAPVRIPT